MKFGYFLTLPGQIEETQDHVNLLWLDDQRLTPEQIAHATTLGKTVVLDVAGCLFNGNATDKLRPDAAERLQTLREYIAAHGRLDAVQVIVPRDEPNLPETDVQHLVPEAVAIIRSVWPEAMVGCIYYNDGEFRNHHLFDVLGFDDYLGGFGICLKPRWYERIKLFFGGFVRRGSYLRFAELLRPDQKSWLIPGGSYGERPERWVAFAKTRPEVWAIVPFLAASNVDGSDIPGILSQPEIRAAYVAAGLSLLESA
jgi:hypothetical protein